MRKIDKLCSPPLLQTIAWVLGWGGWIQNRYSWAQKCLYPLTLYMNYWGMPKIMTPSVSPFPTPCKKCKVYFNNVDGVGQTLNKFKVPIVFRFWKYFVIWKVFNLVPKWWIQTNYVFSQSISAAMRFDDVNSEKFHCKPRSVQITTWHQWLTFLHNFLQQWIFASEKAV